MGTLLILGAISGAIFYIPLNLALAVSDNAATIAIAGQLGAPFALILSIIFLGDRIGLPRLAGIVMAFAGVMLLAFDPAAVDRSEEHTSELQSLMRISYAVFCLKTKNYKTQK